MKNDIFNPGRFGKLLVADLRNYISEHSVNLIVFSLIGVAIFLIVGAFSIIFGTEWYSLGLGGRTTIMLITGFLFAILNAFVTAKITGMQFSAHTVWFMAAFSAVFLLYDTLLTFFATKARTAKGMEWANFKAMAVVKAVTVAE